ncbi:MAG: hypothetical protein ABS84_03835 [Rubrivivax sp. SCN 71-131]|nr:MAG: hypothetical protein ABS84_03835 [Rubrivivax sp. SCN 71-131]
MPHAMTTPDFAHMVPGFDFLQGLMKSAGSSLPGASQWIAPTLDAEEVDKRIQELRTVQFWLEQNARMLAATIQALEVQRMTLATLQTMNVPMSELRESMKIDPAAFATRTAAPPATAAPAATQAKPATPATPATAAPAAPPAVDPLQWWGALTRQFTDLATKAMQEMPAEAAHAFAKATAATAPAGAARAADRASGKAAATKKRRAAAKRPAAKGSP